MQKHRSKRKERGLRWKDSNRTLSESESALIRSLAERLDGELGFELQYLQSEFLSKFCEDSIVSPDDRRQNAIDKWVNTELSNAETNLRLRHMDEGFNILPRVTFSRFVRHCRRLIASILGPLSDELVLGTFSGGASTSRSRRESLPALKYLGVADCSSGAYAYIDVIHRMAPMLRQYGSFLSINDRDSAILFTVPKKTDIDRCACKEPDVNMFLQKGVGRHIRRQLLRFGINLNDQSRNRDLARVGSAEGHLATLDLSSASDTITIEVVRTLLPSDWFLYLNDIRSQSVQLPCGTTFRTEMFSSMGNGFTFELESLIFYALMRTVAYFEGVSGIISVYGDDIVIPSGMYDMASFVLRTFGFVLNAEKSFSTGPFRESCGGHYYLGSDVTPFYLKRPPTHLTDAIRVANQLRRWAFAEPHRAYATNVESIWISLRDMVPQSLWGGRDLAVDTQLVTSGPPMNTLLRCKHDRTVDDTGRYLAWHNLHWNRSSLPEPTGGEASTDTLRCRTKRARPGAPVVTSEFYIELFGRPVLE